MILALYSYFGYYNICYVGDEVRNPGRIIPRAILLSAVLVCVLFVGLHLAMLGTVSWRHVAAQDPNKYSLPADFMSRAYRAQGRWAVVLVTLLLVWSCFGSAFAGLLGYSASPTGLPVTVTSSPAWARPSARTASPIGRCCWSAV